MKKFISLVVFRIDRQRYAIELDVVERIIRAVEVTPLPHAPSIVIGVIDMEGHVLPVLNLRRRFRLAERAITPSDQFLIARTAARTVALVVDITEGVIDVAGAGIVDANQVVPGVGQIRGVVHREDGLVLIHDLEAFLSLEEGEALDRAMSEEAVHGG
jgi:purine-binding chemotaxis protein CheW